MRFHIFYLSFIFLFFLNLLFILFPFINNEIVIINEFMNIPDILKNGSIVKLGNENDLLKGVADNLIKLRFFPYKILEGMFFHHHMSFIEPAWLLNQGDNTPIHQYGILVSLLISSLASISNDMLSIESYFKINYGSYFIFYFFIFLLLKKFIKNKINILIYFSLISLLIYSLGFLILYMTPTVSPLRQIFSPIIIYVVLLYFTNFKKIFINCIFIFLVIYSFYNFHASVFIIFSIILIYLLLLITKKKTCKYSLYLSSTCFIIILVLNFYFDFNSGNSFSEIGIFFGSSLTFSSTLLIVFILGLFYSIISSTDCLKNNDLQLLFLIFYSSMSLVFYAWNPSIVHLSQIFWIILFTLIFWIDKYLKKINSISIFFFAFTILTIIPTAESYFYKKTFYYDKIIDKISVFNWDFPNAKIKSTIDPILIDDSCKKFQKYHINKDIVMISEYDLFLPYVCGFKNKGFYPQLGQGLISEKFYNKALEYYDKQKPEYIFVDKAISNNNMDKDNFGFYSMISDYAFKKINYISQIKNVYNDLKIHYDLVEKGKLINVYKRKNK